MQYAIGGRADGDLTIGPSSSSFPCHALISSVPRGLTLPLHVRAAASSRSAAETAFMRLLGMGDSSSASRNLQTVPPNVTFCGWRVKVPAMLGGPTSASLSLGDDSCMVGGTSSSLQVVAKPTALSGGWWLSHVCVRCIDFSTKKGAGKPRDHHSPQPLTATAAADFTVEIFVNGKDSNDDVAASQHLPGKAMPLVRFDNIHWGPGHAHGVEYRRVDVALSTCGGSTQPPSHDMTTEGGGRMEEQEGAPCITVVVTPRRRGGATTAVDEVAEVGDESRTSSCTIVVDILGRTVPAETTRADTNDGSGRKRPRSASGHVVDGAMASGDRRRRATVNWRDYVEPFCVPTSSLEARVDVAAIDGPASVVRQDELVVKDDDDSEPPVLVPVFVAGSDKQS